MLELLSAGQKALLEDLQIVLTKSERIKQYINKIHWTDNKDVKAVLRIQLDIAALSQRSQPLSNAELVKILNLSPHKITKIMEELEQKGIVTLIKRRPKTYKIQDEFTDSVFE